MRRNIAAVAVALLLVVVFLSLPTIRAAAQDSDIEQMIENAKTPADHEAVAAYYDKEAAAADEQVKVHQHLLEGYKKMPRFSTMTMHCDRMVQAYKSAAREARTLAEEHRKMGKAAGKPE